MTLKDLNCVDIDPEQLHKGPKKVFQKLKTKVNRTKRRAEKLSLTEKI